MDDPAIAPDEHRLALRGLARLNRWSFAAGPIWRAMLPMITGATGPVRVLDVACGSGDVAVAVARLAKASGYELELTGLDLSELALEEASKRARWEGVAFEPLRVDILSEDVPGSFDVVMSSLFIHHLPTYEAPLVLERMRKAAHRGVVISDLARTRAGLALAIVGARTLTRSRIVHVDSARSVRAALSLAEFASIASEAGMANADIRPIWPQRLLLTWTPEREARS